MAGVHSTGSLAAPDKLRKVGLTQRLILNEKKVVGAGFRPNARCPICGSIDRERLVFLYLVQELLIRAAHLNILHIAPEFALGNFLGNIHGIYYLTADISAENVIFKMDLTRIPLPDNYFDGIICNHVLEHILDDQLAMRELYRVLKPGGWAILQVPFSKTLIKTFEDCNITSTTDRERLFGQRDHVRIYGADYVDRLKSSGFLVKSFQWWNAIKGYGGKNNRYALLPDENLYIVNKPT